MNDLTGMMLAVGAGLALGALYFGGLWLTLQRLPDSPRPALLIGGSYILRLAVTLGGLYLVMGDSWQRAAACLVGFTVTRIVMARVWRPYGSEMRRTTANGGERRLTATTDGDEKGER